MESIITNLANIYEKNKNISHNSFVCYKNILATKKIIFNNNKIYLNISHRYPEIINWHNLKKYFQQNKISVCTLRGIGVLRKIIVSYLLEKIGYNKICYVENGSTTPLSDLDFTYVTYKYPSKVIPTMVQFYNLFSEIFDDFPHNVFDTNFYITSTIITPACYSEITNENIKSLFVLENNFYRLRNYSNSEYIKYDENICFEILRLSFEERKKYSEKSIENLLIYARKFYNILTDIDKNTLDKDNLLLQLRTLFYFMSLYSNESYISDATFSFIVLRNSNLTIREKYLSFTDNYAYILYWLAFYRQSHFMEYFDIVCKYIIRCYDSLLGTPFENNINIILIKHASHWRFNIRGKQNLNSDLAFDTWKNISHFLIQSNLNSPILLCELFTTIYRSIKQQFMCNKFEMQQIYTIQKNIDKNNISIQNKKIIYN